MWSEKCGLATRTIQQPHRLERNSPQQWLFSHKFICQGWEMSNHWLERAWYRDQLHVLPPHHRLAVNWSLESTPTKSSTELGSTTTQFCPSPSCPLQHHWYFLNVLQAFGNFGGCQNNTVPRNIIEDSLHFLSAKSSLLCSWQPYNRAKYYQHFTNAQK